jgi:hypothetical protein
VNVSIRLPQAEKNRLSDGCNGHHRMRHEKTSLDPDSPGPPDLADFQAKPKAKAAQKFF